MEMRPSHCFILGVEIHPAGNMVSSSTPINLARAQESGAAPTGRGAGQGVTLAGANCCGCRGPVIDRVPINPENAAIRAAVKLDVGVFARHIIFAAGDSGDVGLEGRKIGGKSRR